VNSNKNTKRKGMKNNYTPLDNKCTFRRMCTLYIYS